MRRSKAELQSFLNQSRQASSLPRSQRFCIGKQGIIDIESGLHQTTIQNSVYRVNPALSTSVGMVDTTVPPRHNSRCTTALYHDAPGTKKIVLNP
jgi:hypothetical protein